MGIEASHLAFQLFKKVGAGYQDFKELNQLLGDVSFYQKDNDKKSEVIQLKLKSTFNFQFFLYTKKGTVSR